MTRPRQRLEGGGSSAVSRATAEYLEKRKTEPYRCTCMTFLGVASIVAVRSVCAGPLDEGFSTPADYDRFLGELIFSQSDVRDDVLKSLEKAGDEG